MKGNYKIYLSGVMSDVSFEEQNEWREYVKYHLEQYEGDLYSKVHVFNPVEYYNFELDRSTYTEKEVFKFDLHQTRTSDLIIVNFNHPKSIGTTVELAVAYEKNIPIIGLFKGDSDALHPWYHELCDKMFSDIDALLVYVKEYYLS